MKSILCKQGYVIDKKLYDDKTIQSIKKELIVKPLIDPAYAPLKLDSDGRIMRDGNGQVIREIDPYPVFLENSNKLCIPKFYGLEKIGKPDKIDELEGVNINVPFNGTIRDLQQNIINDIFPKIKNNGGGLLSVPCGYGKTVMALNIVSLLAKKTLVVVHKTFLVNQWIQRIKQYLPTARIGTIQQDTVDIDDKDIVIGMLQSISMRDYDKNIFDDFSCLIVDECHHTSSKVFSQALPKITCKYTLGLSATPKRKDRLEKVFHWYLGPILYQIVGKTSTFVTVNVYNYNSKDNKFKDILNRYTKKPQLPTMITNLTEINQRNKFIINSIKDIKEDDPGRNILIVSSRREHLTLLKDEIDKLNKFTTGYYVGGMKEKDLKITETKELIFSTSQMCSEGLDIPKLDTVMLVTPFGDVEQTIGRILRKKEEDYDYMPLIIDIADNLKGLHGMNRKRLTLFKKCKYDISLYDVIDDIVTFSQKIDTEQKEIKELQNEDLFLDE